VPVEIELALLVRGIARAHRAATEVAIDVIDGPLADIAFAANAIDDPKLVDPIGQHGTQETIKLLGLPGVAKRR
jgi:hypothetical protein